ncbi:pseudouridine synthase [Myxococcus xanthus]|uniref:Pseudouridine synthase n=1 Tax=Myxococcus xanthus TaxID=34 RepID=A0AAE6G0Y4_MYXXA|nr:pseudouridine synthase [Myxococcus xanthus]QDE68891.1 pseudouridine synthase [Myxococcus xanthus]QDE76167.1 pseudouridine synthase [Myxococcus xanthus]
MAAERLQKYLARAGVASRRHAEELITAGRVAVNNKTVTELGSRVEPGTDLVTVDGTLVTPPDESSYFLLYKPVGVVTTLSDPQGRPTVANYVEETGKRLFPVGRLDYDAEGALLFTDDGALAHKLTHPSFQVPRTYLAKVKGAPDVATLDKLRGGVRLEDGMATPVSVGVFEAAERNTWLKIVVAEGRPHLIKRLCAAVGHPVVRLFRPSYAGVGVEGLRPGELRPLKTSEVELLHEVSDGKTAPPTGELKLPPRRHGRAAPGFDSDDEAELSMDDDAPVAAKPARKAPARAAKAASAGGSSLARFGRPKGASAEGKPARRSFGGDEGAPRGRSFGGDKAGAPRGRGVGRSFGSDEGKPARRSFGGDEGKPARRSFGGDEGRPARRSFGSDEGKPARRSFGSDEGRPARRSFGGDEGKPARRSFGSDEGRPARRSFGGDEGRPARRSFGGDEGKPARRSFGGDEGKPARRSFGGDEGRPARRSFGGDEGAPRGRSFGGDRAGAPRGRGAGRSFGGDESGAPRSRGPGRSFGSDTGARGAGRAFGGAGGARRSFGGDEGGAPKSRGAGRPERREWSAGGDAAPRTRAPRAGGEGRPERKSWGAGGGAGRAPRGEGRPYSPRSGGAGAGRPERREWKPRAEGADAPRGRGGPRREGSEGGRPARSTWTPTDESGNPRERVVRAGARKGAPAEKSGGFQDWGKKKERASAPSWSNERPRGGAGRPPPRGPRRPR